MKDIKEFMTSIRWKKTTPESSHCVDFTTTIKTGERGAYISFASLKSIYLHIDLDVPDWEFVSVNSYNAPGGLLPEELFHAISAIKKKSEIAAIAFTAYDPSLHPKHKVQNVVNDL